MKTVRLLLSLSLMLSIISCASNIVYDTEHPTETCRNSEGISDSIACLFNTDNPIQWNSQILSQQSEFTISFWINPETNWMNATIFTYWAENGDHFSLTGSGTNADGTYHGLSVEYQHGNNVSWITADNQEDTLSVDRWNYISIAVLEKQLDVYLNGKLISSGKTSEPINKISNATLYFGTNPNLSIQSITGTIEQFRIIPHYQTVDTIIEDYRELYPQTLLNEISFADMDDVTESYWLYPTIGDEEFPVSWKSNHSSLTVQGNGTLVDLGQEENSYVILSAKLNAYGREYQKDFPLIIRGNNSDTFAYRDSRTIDLKYNNLINADTELPVTGDYGSVVSWSIEENPDCILRDNQIHRTSNKNNPQVSFNITVTNKESSYTLKKDLIVLDAYAGYIMSYFIGDQNDEQSRIAWSRDGLNWTPLENGQIFKTDGLGTEKVRDPFIGRDSAGEFILIATEGYDNSEIYFWRSSDLINIDPVSLLPVAVPVPSTNESGTRAWAPEFTYQEDEDLYYIYFSDPTNNDQKPGSIYYVTTKDFLSFTYPKIFFGPGYQVIDGTILALDGKNWLFYKDERIAASTIFYASGTTISKGFQKAYDDTFLSTHKFLEGPFVVPTSTDSYYLYVDNYPAANFYVAEFTKLGDDNDIHWLDQDEYHLPEEKVHHGSVIQVTEKELNQIIESYS